MWLVTSQVPLDTYGPQALEPALRDLEWVSSIAVAHEAIVEHFTRAKGSAVVPMKLFTMFSSIDKAVDEMRGRLTELRNVLGRIAGCEEWGVRVTRTDTKITATSVGVRRIQSGAAFLAAKKAVRDQAHQAARIAAEAADATYDALASIAREARRREDAPPSATTAPLLDATFLVPSRSRTRFHGAAQKRADACATAGAEMVITGPWPAYNFVQSPEHVR
jgi:hypothetical protein